MKSYIFISLNKTVNVICKIDEIAGSTNQQVTIMEVKGLDTLPDSVPWPFSNLPVNIIDLQDWAAANNYELRVLDNSNGGENTVISTSTTTTTEAPTTTSTTAGP